MTVRPGRATYILLGLLFLYAAASFQTRWFNDDAFITFRYGEHLARGFGFVWNAGGVPVEGSTSLGWTVQAALAILLGLNPLHASWAAGLAWGVAGLALTYVAGRRLFDLSPGFALIAPAMLFLNRQYISSSVSGMETRAAAVLAFAATLLLLYELGREERRGFGSGALFLLATLVRPEAPLLHLAAGVGAFAMHPRRKTFRALLESGSVHALGLVLLTVWRLQYFGQPLPNTFYVKVGGLQLERGLPYVGQFLLQNYAWLFGLVIVAGLPALFRSRSLALGVFGVQTLAWLGWLAVLGGGRWEFRLADPLLPVLALWTGISASAAVGLLPQRIRRAGIPVIAALLVGSQVSTVFLPFRNFGGVISAPQAHAAAAPIRQEGIVLSRFLGPEDRISTGWAGGIPYHSRAWHFDPYGLNDPEIARRPFEREATVFHQRRARWEDIVENRVMFCDVFNRFLHFEAYDPKVPRVVNSWIPDDAPIYSVKVHPKIYWVFTSTNTREELDAWLSERELSVHAMERLARAHRF